MKQTKWHFELKDGKGGIIIMPKPSTEAEDIEVCRHQFGEERLKEVTA